MKRLACLLLVLLLLPFSACADMLTEIEIYFNSIAKETGSLELPETYETTTTDEGKTQIIYRFSPTFAILYTFDDDGSIKSLSVGCSSDDDYVDFLGACNAGVFTVMKGEYDLSTLGDILFQFIGIRNGKEASQKFSFSGDYAYTVERMDENRIVFIMVKVK